MTNFSQTIGPIRNVPIERLTELNRESVLSTALIFVCVFAFYFAIHKITKVVLSKTPCYDKNSKKIPIYHCVSIVLVSSLLIAFGWSTELIKGIIFMQILLYASVSDIQTHEVKDFISVLIFITGFIGVTFIDIPMKLMGSFVIGGMLLICAMVSGNRLGGADVKLSAACTFLLGFSKSIAGLIIGLIVSVIANLIIQKQKKTKNQPFPLVPYLSIGFMLMYFC